MKKLFVFIFSSFSLLASGQVADIQSYYLENYRYFEGGSSRVLIDKQTPLNTLIERLNSNWELEETFKGYWIGYTDDMYSIAAHKNEAIQPLLKFIQYSKNDKSKLGAIYCLHLIGIDSKIVGRFYEKFVNVKARQALLSLIYQPELIDLVVFLLARDPWRSDLPILAFYLKYYPNNLTLINSLFRYEKNNAPFRQNINVNNDTLPVFILDTSGLHRLGDLVKVYKKKKLDNSINTKNNIVVHSEITNNIIKWEFHANSWNNSLIDSYFKCTVFQLSNGNCKEIQKKLYDFFVLSEEKVSDFSYCDLRRDIFHHYVVNGRILVICTLDQTHKRWRQFYSRKN